MGRSMTCFHKNFTKRKKESRKMWQKKKEKSDLVSGQYIDACKLRCARL